MLTFAVTPVSRGRRWSDVPCHSLTPHSIAPRGKLQIFSTFPSTTSFSRTVACAKVELNRFLLGSFICPGEGEESSALAKFMASGSDSSTPSSLLKRQKEGTIRNGTNEYFTLALAEFIFQKSDSCLFVNNLLKYGLSFKILY